MFTIQKWPVPQISKAVRPNSVLSKSIIPITRPPEIIIQAIDLPKKINDTGNLGDVLPTNSLWDLLKGVYSMLNRTNPEITKHC